MSQRIILVLLSMFMSGCTAMRYQQHTNIDYVPPTSISIKKSKEYSVDFESAWKASVAVFAMNNFQIKTMDKASGIIAAEAFYNPSDMIGMVSPGETVIVKYETEETMNPNGFVGSANPEYVRQNGTVTSARTYEVARTKKQSEYAVTALLNLFLLEKNGYVVINVNTKFQSAERIGKKVPQPISNGTLEKEIFEFLDSQLLFESM